MTKNENNIYLIVGLGNPGREYQATRHNVGFLAVGFLAEKLNWGKFKQQKKFQVETLETKFQNKKIIAAKPRTFMNNSGEAVAALKNF